MTKPKINHPFQVPDDFFDHLEKELEIELDKISLQKKKRSVVFQILKYAAIIFAAVLLGRQSVKIYPGNTGLSGDTEILSVDLVLSQVSDEDVTEFILDNITQDVLNQ
jgi:hypothetical protein